MHPSRYLDTVSGVTLTAVEVGHRLDDAFDRLVDRYARWGGHRFHGWTDYDDPSNYFGGVVWSEADCVLRFCLELEVEFPEQVHCEFSIDKATRHDWEQRLLPVAAGKRPGRQAIDIVVSDLGSFRADVAAQDAFRHRRHEAFIDAKWLKKGWREGPWRHEARRRVEEVKLDLAQLAWHLKVGRCLTAAMLVFDDEDFLSEYSPAIEWPPEVRPLVVGPAILKERGFLLGD